MLAFRSFTQTVVRSTQLLSATSLQSLRYFADLPDHIEISMPALSPTMSNGSIAQWLVKEGDAVKPGDVLASIQTDKSTLDFVTQDEGFIAKILKPAGDDLIDVGVPIAVMVDNKDDVTAYQKEAGSEAPAATPATPAAPAEPAPVAAAVVPPVAAPKDRVFASPLARAEAAAKNIDLNSVKGTGPNGRIISADIHEYVPPAAAPVAAPVATPVAAVADDGRGYEDMSLSQMRKVIAKRLTESKVSIPHYYLSTECQMDNLLELRSRLNKELGDRGKLSINDFILKASALTLRDVPEVNASWMNDFIRKYNYVDISVAVAIKEGLITPIVPDTDKKGLLAISNEVRALAKQAKENTLKPEQYSGGTFTVSNLGMYGIKSFTAIINPPQSCILAVGNVDKKLIPIDNDPTKFKIGSFTTFTLSCDHRIVDGALGATWLKVFKQYIEKPETMLF